MKIEEKIASLLIKKRRTLALAESCTGGLLSNKITNIPGSSKFFKLGFITYSNEAKIKILKVPSRIIKDNGAVSYQVASKMANNTRQIAKTDFAVAITGIAGPSGATKAKPIGLVYIAAASENKSVCVECLLKGSRQSIKSQSCSTALNLLLGFLSE